MFHRFIRLSVFLMTSSQSFFVCYYMLSCMARLLGVTTFSVLTDTCSIVLNTLFYFNDVTFNSGKMLLYGSLFSPSCNKLWVAIHSEKLYFCILFCSVLYFYKPYNCTFNICGCREFLCVILFEVIGFIAVFLVRNTYTWRCTCLCLIRPETWHHADLCSL